MAVIYKAAQVRTLLGVAVPVECGSYSLLLLPVYSLASGVVLHRNRSYSKTNIHIG